jgi:hypothetical protein
MSALSAGGALPPPPAPPALHVNVMASPLPAAPPPPMPLPPAPPVPAAGLMSPGIYVDPGDAEFAAHQQVCAPYGLARP